jgi:outer membrane beta-barrel protein
MKFINSLVAFLVLQVSLQAISVSAFAAKIQFPTEELASESVLPKFDNPIPVRNRNVETAGHLEVAGFYGWTLNDAFADSTSLGGIFTYHFNEFHALQIYAAKLSGKANEYPQQIFDQTSGAADIRGKTAVPKAAYILAYQVTPFYGKLSFTKQGVINMSIYGTLGAGSYQLQDGNTTGLSTGIGAKFYFTNRFNLRADYRFFFYSARDPIDPAYGKRAQLNSILTIGLGFLL